MSAKARLESACTSWAYAVVAVPLVLLIVEVLRGAVHETSTVRTQSLREQMQRLQSQAMQHAKGLEVLLEANVAEETPWSKIRDQAWFTAYWSKIRPSVPDVYAAIVDATGQIVMHSDPAKTNHRLESGWYERKVSEAGPDVVFTESSALGDSAFDVTVPLTATGNTLGDYHEALDARWLESKIAAEQRAVLLHWGGVLALVGIVDAAAVAALVYLARGQGRAWHNLQCHARQRLRELAQIGSGLAHEIRNPLHAMRINMHTLRRSFSSRSPLPEDELVATIEESESAIDRLDELMRDLLQYTDRGTGKPVAVDLVNEVRSTLSLLSETMQQEKIDVNAKLPATLEMISIDPVRLRQLLLNVLTLAQHRAGRKGAIELALDRVNGGVELAIGDSGPLLADEQRSRIFEPFQAPDEIGSGLGLALVQVYVEEAGGRACWDQATPNGRCRLWFPLAPPTPQGGPL